MKGMSFLASKFHLTLNARLNSETRNDMRFGFHTHIIFEHTTNLQVNPYNILLYCRYNSKKFLLAMPSYKTTIYEKKTHMTYKSVQMCYSIPNQL